MNINLIVRCSQCDNTLAIDKQEWSHYEDAIILSVRPCPTCIKDELRLLKDKIDGLIEEKAS